VGGAILDRLAPQTDHKHTAIQAAGLDTSQIFSSEDLVSGEEVFFIATGVTDGTLVSGVRYHGHRAQTESIILRGRSKPVARSLPSM
jgi:fructose-1,6-bisphosphatase II